MFRGRFDIGAALCDYLLPPPKEVRNEGTDAGWSSLVARWAHNPKVAGSNPVPATIETSAVEAFQKVGPAICSPTFFPACSFSRMAGRSPGERVGRHR